MFDIGFWELTLLAVIGLIILGPERLPVVARTLGLWVGRAKGYVRGITSELERESRADEIREQVNQTRKQIESDTREAIEPVRGVMPRDKSSEPGAAGSGNETRSDSGTQDGDDAPAPADGARQREGPPE